MQNRFENPSTAVGLRENFWPNASLQGSIECELGVRRRRAMGAAVVSRPRATHLRLCAGSVDTMSTFFLTLASYEWGARGREGMCTRATV